MEWTRGHVIGRGSTATVSLATSVSSGEIFAVKSTELSKSMFLQREQQFLSKLNCPRIVKYIGFDVTNQNSKHMYNLFMEYAASGTLHDLINRHGGRLDEPEIRLYTQHILQGLDYLHQKGLVHCDIKSQNILITKDGAKIADFGCARSVEEVACDGGAVMPGFPGTPAFMAPEVVRGEEQGLAADVWAVGCTVIEMASGSNPWTELSDPISALYKIGFSADVPEFPRWLSEKGKEFLSKCFLRDPKERWTVKELLDHPFFDELETIEVKEISIGSPSCVLDQHFWDSLEGLGTPHNLTPKSCSNSAAERIKKLIGDSPNWSCEEDWTTVRSNDTEVTVKCLEEKYVVSGNDYDSSVETALLSWNSVSYEPEELDSSIFDEDLLMDLCIENVMLPLVEHVIFETDNDNICCCQSKIFFVFHNFLFVLHNFRLQIKTSALKAK